MSRSLFKCADLTTTLRAQVLTRSPPVYMRYKYNRDTRDNRGMVRCDGFDRKDTVSFAGLVCVVVEGRNAIHKIPADTRYAFLDDAGSTQGVFPQQAPHFSLLSYMQLVLFERIHSSTRTVVIKYKMCH